MADGKISQPEWATPQRSADEPVLRMYNSLTKTKTEFIPAKGRLIKWYNCGPTVYDASHTGHARNYVSQDIIRRILVDYFGYDVHFVMNITDIDDKIILRARQTHLVNELRIRSTSLTEELVSQVQEAWISYFHSKLSPILLETDRPVRGQEDVSWTSISQKLLNDVAWVTANKERNEKFMLHINSLTAAHGGLAVAMDALKAGNKTKEQADALIMASNDVLALWLDAKYGSTITDPSISKALSTYWEKQFMNDMERLHVRPPDTLTRVTEYVPEITEFVQRIIDNGFGYATSDGSVYFDTRTFDGARGGQKRTDNAGAVAEWAHSYAKLQPWSKGNKELLEEGEGSLGSSSGKRSPSDFALWKASKPGEPSWPSPWGAGRPGWHIECSVMASEILGENMDIHSGGIDLAFPHHDNEIAQSEAYHDCRQWVNYFIHTGHLHIEGLKMSKSLKNLITIDEILQTFTVRQLRIAFLTQLWSAKMDFKQSSIAEVRAIEATFDNFFTVSRALIAEGLDGPSPDSRHHYEQPEKELMQYFQDIQHAFRVALCDSFNTPVALAKLQELVSRTNIYISRGRTNVNVGVIQVIARWVTSMLKMFGLGEGRALDANPIGWGEVEAAGEVGVDRETVLMPYLRVLSAFRDNVRQLAISQASSKEILALCDRLRDVDLVPLGVALDDQEDGKALVKLAPPEVLLKAREEKLAQIAERVAKKSAQADADRAKKLAKLEKGKLSPTEMFRPPNVPEGTYGSWNDEGFPLTDGQGVELPKSRVKKLTKDWEGQKKAYAEWLEWSK